MKKYSNIVIRIIIVILLLLAVMLNAYAKYFDPKLEQSINESDYQKVIVILRKDSVEDTRASIFGDSRLEKIRIQAKIVNDEFSSAMGNSANVNIERYFSTSAGVIVNINKQGLEELKNNRLVESVYSDAEGEYLLQDSVPLIQADKKTIGKFGFDGRGQTICVIDTGIDFRHPEFTDLVGNGAVSCSSTKFTNGECSKLIDGYDFYTPDDIPEDTTGHGTAVAAIAGGRILGVAQRANIAPLKNGASNPVKSATISAVDWCINNSDSYNISVITMSFQFNTSSQEDCYPDDPLSLKIKEAIDLGIFVTAASGNSGLTDELSFPACVGGVTSVGISNKDDEILSIGNRDDFLDILAPAESICSAVAILATYFNPSYCFKAHEWVRQSSTTSFAAPHVAGAAAILAQARGQTLTSPLELEDILQDTGKLIYDTATSNYFPRVDVLSALQVDWPTENHDYRRTGFTLLKGDLQAQNQVTSNLNMFLDSTTGSEHVVKATVADLDGNDRMDQVIFVHKNSINNLTKMYGLETGRLQKTKPAKKWNNYVEVVGGAVYFPVTLADIDGDENKEIVTGVRNGTIYAYDVSGSSISQKWKYHLTERFSSLSEVDEVYFNGGTAVTDIDLDGDQEIIFADVDLLELDGTWDGKVYVVDGGTGSLQTSYSVGNGGTYATISVANVDSDDNPEIVVPTRYGIKVLDYNAGSLSTKCSNNHGQIEGSAVIADVDMDNEYGKNAGGYAL